MYQPDYPAALGLISNLNSDDLKEILNDDTKFEDLIKDVKQFKDLESEKEMLMASNRSVAEFNLAKEPQLTEEKERLRELAEKAQALCHNVKSKADELQSKGGSMSIDTALALIQTAAAEMEEESETVAQQFLSGDIDIDQFLEQFVNRRRIMHLRKVKADKMKELMTRAPIINPSMPNYVNTPTTNSFYPPVINNSVPYPTGPLNMPMPNMFRPNF